MTETLAGLVEPNNEPFMPSAPIGEDAIQQHLDRRERLAGEQNDREHAAAASKGPEAAGAEATGPAQQEVVEAPEANLVSRNSRNTVAQSQSSTLAEPAAAKDSSEALYMGNTYVSRSADNGSTWTAETVPAGPSFAPVACCDPDAIHHVRLDTTFSLFMYLNSAGTDGAVRIFVRRGAISGGNDCSFDFNPAGTTTVSDYPHLGVSNNFVYLTVNNLDTQGTANSSDDSWSGSQVVRYNANQMANCTTTSFNTFTKDSGGQRVFVPIEGATTTMFWGQVERTLFFQTFRIYAWPESTTTVSQSLRGPIAESNFTNPDCRGGTGDFDWIEKSTAFSITGFRLRGALAGSTLLFLWNVNRDDSHPQAHIHAAAFRTSDLALIAQPHVFNTSTCTGFPALSGNSQGDFALSQAAGGRAGGLGTSTPCSSEATCAARGYISIDDEGTAGIFFATRTQTAAGTHNRRDGRFGDYFTVRKADNCPLAWAATNYSLLNGNTSASDVNARYIEFRSSLDPVCP